MQIAIAQMNVIPGRPGDNTETMLQFIQRAKDKGADLIIFPEMAVPGYLLGDTWEERSFLRDIEAANEAVIRAADGIAVLFGSLAVDWAKKNNDGRPRKYNAFFAAQNKRLVSPGGMPYPFQIKTLLPNYREFDDTRHFYSLQKLAGELGTQVSSLLSPISLKLGDRRYTIGCLLCEDGWSENYSLEPMEILKAKGNVDFYVNISASPYTLGKNEKRHRLFGREARDADAPLIYVNNVGLQNNGKTVFTFDGASTVYNAKGQRILEIDAYEENIAFLRLEAIADAAPIRDKEESDIAHIYKSIAYGVKTFLSRINMKKVVIGVSGGIDSAVAAALYANVLGRENVLLVNMPGVFNSETTKGLAAGLAANIGCRYAVLPIQESVEHTKKQLETTPITFFADGSDSHLQVSSFTMENIQARDRSSRILAGVAAAFGGGFTCNANKAETTVGYSTLYGDQSGFLAALADLWKFQIYDLARYLNEHVYRREVIPQATIDIVPSAELSDAQNVDEGKGDPLCYPYHDFLFRSFVERWEKAAPQDILEWYVNGTLEEQLGCRPGIVKELFKTPADFIADLERWWNLFTGMAIAKRIQSPPILAVSRRAYGFDHRESQNGTYYTVGYRSLKKQLLKSET
ncbi:NAD+ synthase [Selenomonas sp. TAMA-11512]|uniref:NAD(+) synthase n=1 Tax=Selenomonas sp. TAMA-11512 TaxID=3095337 RepID=UPI0030860ABE|nr:NAD+ synthase [Selenomonas sp. TAMA-11512]